MSNCVIRARMGEEGEEQTPKGQNTPNKQTERLHTTTRVAAEGRADLKTRLLRPRRNNGDMWTGLGGGGREHQHFPASPETTHGKSKVRRACELRSLFAHWASYVLVARYTRQGAEKHSHAPISTERWGGRARERGITCRWPRASAVK